MGTDQDMAKREGATQEGSAPVAAPLHRKVQAGRAERQARGMSLVKALRLTLAKVADDLFGLSMGVIAVRSDRCPVDRLQDAFADAGLLMVLDGPGGARGAAALDPALVGALIQQQTMGRVLPAADAPPRPMTPTDASISAPLLDVLLARAALLPEDPQEQELIAGFAFGARVEDARVLSMALDAPDHTLIDLTVDIAGGIRQGRILLCLPHRARVPQPEPSDRPDDASADCKKGAGTFATTVLHLKADLRVSLAQIRMPLHRLGHLTVGECLDLGRAAFEDVRLETLGGRPVGRGVLGQVDGARAVQVQASRAGALRLRRRAEDRAELDLPDVTEAFPAPHDHGASAGVSEEMSIAKVNDDDRSDLSDLPEVNTG